MKKLKYILTLLFFSHLSSAQSIQNTLDGYMAEVRQGSYQAVPKELLNTSKEEELFEGLQSYTSDSLDIIRSKAYYVFKRVVQKSSNAEVRNVAISRLISAINDRDTGISGNASEALTGFKKQDFTSSHKEAIGRLIKLETPHLDQLLKLAGYLEMTAHKAQIHQVINSQTPYKNKWAAYLALARMDDGEAIAYLRNKLQKAPINDDFVYDFVPDLVYTRQPEIFRFLETIIQSNEKSCQSADPDDADKILCGYRLMEYLAPVIEDFPLAMDEYGDLQVEDYEAALQELRSWFRKNPSYAILKDSF